MRKFLLLALGFIFSLALVTPTVYAKNFIYSVPPPNDTSLNIENSQPVHRVSQPRPHPFASSQHKLHHLAASHLKIHSALVSRAKHHHRTLCHHPSHRATGLYVYYALPAPACCGEHWALQKANCCAQSGEWQTSPYATFKAAPGDFIYSATNDDEYRSYDAYEYDVANGEIDDPEYY